jgi:hypothetical protein
VHKFSARWGYEFGFHRALLGDLSVNGED